MDVPALRERVNANSCLVIGVLAPRLFSQTFRPSFALKTVATIASTRPRAPSRPGYITPKNMLAGRQKEIHAERDRKLEAARERPKDSSAAGCLKKAKTLGHGFLRRGGRGSRTAANVGSRQGMVSGKAGYRALTLFSSVL